MGKNIFDLSCASVTVSCSVSTVLPSGGVPYAGSLNVTVYLYLLLRDAHERIPDL
jgi:hypothetical protein